MWRFVKLTIPCTALWAAAVAGQEVSGNVNSVWNDREDWVYEFSAQKDIAGRVNGQWRADNQAIDALIVGDVDCLSLHGSQAWLGITITQIENFEQFAPVEWGHVVGGQIIWRIEDNGDGSDGAEVDRTWGLPTIKLLNDLFAPIPPVTSCEDKPDLTVLVPNAFLNDMRRDVKSGDILIRPEPPATVVGTGTWGEVKWDYRTTPRQK